jgi:hypothetical protein
VVGRFISLEETADQPNAKTDPERTVCGGRQKRSARRFRHQRERNAVTTIQSNRKPADRLAEIREQIRALEVEEAELRQSFLDGEHDLVGDDHQVIITASVMERIDVKSLRRDFNPSALRPYLKTTNTTFVRTELKRHG